MSAFTTIVTVQTKRTLRDPASTFFMLAFAPMLAVALGLIFGNDPVPEFGNRGYLDANLVSFTGIIVVISGLIVTPVDLITQRESGALRRFRATPLRPVVYIAADVVVRFVISLVGIALMIAIGVLGFGARLDGSAVSILLAAALGTLAFLAVGYLLAAALPSQGVALAVGNVLVYPLILLSGATVPLSVLPDGVRQVARFSPLTQMVQLLQGLWAGEAWSAHWVPLVVLVGLLAVATAVAARFFRWQ